MLTLYLHHGRSDPNETPEDWGPNTSPLENATSS